MSSQKTKAYLDIVTYVESNSLSNNVKINKVVSGKAVMDYRGELSDTHLTKLKDLLETHNSIQ